MARCRRPMTHRRAGDLPLAGPALADCPSSLAELHGRIALDTGLESFGPQGEERKNGNAIGRRKVGKGTL